MPPGPLVKAPRTVGRGLRLAAAAALAVAPPAQAELPTSHAELSSSHAGAVPAHVEAAAILPAILREWRISSFHADIQVFRSGDIVVTETIRPRFVGQYNGIFRTIPVRYRTPAGFAYNLRLAVESVTDGAGNDLRYEEGREGEYRKLTIWVPGAVDATRTVVIRYRVNNGLRHFEAEADRQGIADAYDELYWNVTGTEWPVPIDAASARVQLPVDVTGIRAQAFTGPYGSVEQDADVRTEGTTVNVQARGPLSFREGLTVGIAWDAGVVTQPSAATRAGWFLRANWPLVLPFFALILMFRTWRSRGKDPDMGSVEPRYEPPEALTPAEVGVVADNSPDMRDITATVVDLAVRGYLEIAETEDKKLLGLITERDYAFSLRKPQEAWGGLEPHERRLLRALFGRSETTVHLSDLKNKFYTHLPDLKDGLMDALVEHGVYVKRPDHVTGRWVALGAGVGIGIAVLGLWAGSALGLATLAVILGAVGTGLVMVGFGFIMPARTREGVELLRKVKGFEEFLERVESDRFKRMITGPEMFERFLPFAMALGVEQQWAAAFADMYREPPDWYHGSHPGHFNSRVFVSDLGDMSGRTASVMQSAPRSSGGSSFGGGGGGGGFSGGGFGGGGGGAF